MFKGKVAVQALFNVIQRKPAIDISDRGEKPQDVMGLIQLRNVAFTYPTRTDKPALFKFNLEIPAGEERVATRSGRLISNIPIRSACLVTNF